MQKLNQQQLEALTHIAQSPDWIVLKDILNHSIQALGKQALGDIQNYKTFRQQIIENAYLKGEGNAWQSVINEVDGAFNKLSKLIEEKKKGGDENAS